MQEYAACKYCHALPHCLNRQGSRYDRYAETGHKAQPAETHHHMPHASSCAPCRFDMRLLAVAQKLCPLIAESFQAVKMEITQMALQQVSPMCVHVGRIYVEASLWYSMQECRWLSSRWA